MRSEEVSINIVKKLFFNLNTVGNILNIKLNTVPQNVNRSHGYIYQFCDDFVAIIYGKKKLIL